MFHGAIVATITPFRNGRLDASALKKLVEFQIRNGTDGIVPCGTTGESATLSYEEHERVIDLVLEAAAGRVPVIAGTGSNNTKEAVLLTRYARKAGANAALVITPYYNKPTQAGLLAHFREVAASADIPLILYNVPSRTGVNMTAETVARLSEVKNIVGVKEASGNLAQVCDILKMTPRTFCVLSGDDGLYFPMLALGEAHRDESDPRQDGACHDGEDPRRVPAPAVRDVRRQPEGPREGPLRHEDRVGGRPCRALSSAGRWGGWGGRSSAS